MTNFVMKQEGSVPFLDVGATYAEIKEQIDLAVQRVLNSRIYVLGPEVEQFETEFSNYVSASYCVGVANGLQALELSLRAVGVKPGDEVIVPSHTFIATWLAATQCGACVVPVEPERDGFNIDPISLEAAINERTRAIVVVHLYGQPAQLDQILKIGKKYNIPIIEDAAQAHGASYKDVKLGSHSDIVAWSFYPSKNLGAFGDGGAITTNRFDLAERIRWEGNYGSVTKYNHKILGTNSRLDPIQAAVLRVKLGVLDEWNKRRVNIATTYTKELRHLPILLPKWEHGRSSVWHLYVIQVENRDFLRKALLKRGIETGIHYPIPPHTQPCYEGQYGRLSLDRTARLSQCVLSLPIGPHLSSTKVEQVIGVLNEVLIE